MSDDAIIRLRGILRDASVEERDWSEVTAETTIESLGFDSLAVLDLLYDLNQEFGVSLEAADVINARTVGEILALLDPGGD